MTAHFEPPPSASLAGSSAASVTFRGLVGDIGGTNARFAIAERDHGKTKLRDFKSFETHGYPNIYAVIADYFRDLGTRPELDYAVLAVAGPVKNGQIKFTNLDWLVTESELAKSSGAKTSRLINDYAALAYALPYMDGDDIKTIGQVTKGFGDVHAVMGAGTGFGASVLVGGAYGPYCLSTESGHASWAPVNDFEADIHRFLRKKLGRVTIENLLSGPGLVNLYQAISFVRGEKALDLTPAQITNIERTANNTESVQGCRYTVEAFLDILASTAGDLALYHLSTAGMFIAGGIAPRLVRFIDEGRFRARMEAKQPLADLVAGIPSHIITHPCAALLGSAHALTDAEITR